MSIGTKFGEQELDDFFSLRMSRDFADLGGNNGWTKRMN